MLLKNTDFLYKKVLLAFYLLIYSHIIVVWNYFYWNLNLFHILFSIFLPHPEQ